MVHTKKGILVFGCVATIFVVLLYIFLGWHEMHVKKISIPEEAVFVDRENAQQIELYLEKNEVNEVESLLLIEGWIIKHETEAKILDIHVLLKDSSSDMIYSLPTALVKRGDITDYFEQEKTEYDDSGFRVSAKNKNISSGTSIYEILIMYHINDELFIIPTGEILGGR